MTRSIHWTRRDLEMAEMLDWADAGEGQRHRERIREALRRKRNIKAQVYEERHVQPVRELIDPDSIEIRVRDGSSLVHFPATVEDIRAVLQRLPSGALNGVASIELSLGAGFQHSYDDPDAERDPLVGRPGGEWLPGVYEGEMLGCYIYHAATIHLFAYVYAPDAPYVDVWQPVFKLQMLGTLVHEVAHHIDGTLRTARGRWSPWIGTHAEPYAEVIQNAWVKEHVVQYLEAAYPEDVRRLRDWTQRHGGASLTLTEIAGDRTRATTDGEDAFTALAKSVVAGDEPEACKFCFAEYLYWADMNDVAIQVLDGLLVEDRMVIEATALKSAVHWQQGELDRAEELAQWVLQRDETNTEAWWTLLRVSEEREEWGAVREIANQLMSLLGPDDHPFHIRTLLLRRAEAQMELGDVAGMEADLKALMEALSPDLRKRRSLWERRVQEIRVKAIHRGLVASKDDPSEGSGA